MGGDSEVERYEDKVLGQMQKTKSDNDK